MIGGLRLRGYELARSNVVSLHSPKGPLPDSGDSSSRKVLRCSHRYLAVAPGAPQGSWRP
eukprot:gene11864-biopygen3608